MNVFGAPAVPRLGRAGGFRIMIEDRGDVGPDVLQGQTDSFIEKANQQKQLVGLFTVFKTNSPQVYLNVDRGACVVRGLDLTDVYATLQATMGSRYTNDFNLFGRTWQVNVQSAERFRNQLDDVRKIEVRNYTRRDGPARRGVESRGAQRPARHHAVQHVSGCGGERELFARHEHRRRHRACRDNSPRRNYRAAWPTSGPN